MSVSWSLVGRGVRVGPGALVGVGRSVAVGRGLGVNVGAGVYVGGTGVLVSVGSGVAVAVGAGVSVGTAVGSGAVQAAAAKTNIRPTVASSNPAVIFRVVITTPFVSREVQRRDVLIAAPKHPSVKDALGYSLPST